MKLLAARACILLFTAWALIVIVPDFARVWSPGVVQMLGFTADNDGRITSIDTSGDGSRRPCSAQPPFHCLKPGDYIDLHKTPKESLQAVFGGMGGLQYTAPDTQITLRLAKDRGLHDEQDVRLDSHPIEPSPLGQWLLLVDEVFGVAFVVLATLLVWQRPNAMLAGFWLYALWFNPGQYFVFYAYLPDALVIPQEVAQSFFQSLGYAGFLLFALRFPNDVAQGWRRTAERMLPLVTLILTILALWSFGTIAGIRTETVARVSYLAGYAIDVLVFVALISTYRRLGPVDRQRLAYILWGCGIGLAAFIVADSNEATTMWAPLWDLAGWAPPEWLFLALYGLNGLVAASIFYAVSSHRVPNVRFALSRSVATTLTWCIVGAVISFAGLVMEHHLESMNDAAVRKATRANVALLAVGMTPILVALSLVSEWVHEKLDELCDRVMFRRLHYAEDIIARACSKLAEAKNVAAIDTHLVAGPVTASGLASAIVLRWDDAQEWYSQEGPLVGWPDETLRTLAVDDPLVTELGKCRAACRVSDVGWNRADVPRGAAAPSIAVPIFVHHRIHAVAIYGARESGDEITPDERCLLGKMAISAASAYAQAEADELRSEVAQLRRLLETGTAVVSSRT